MHELSANTKLRAVIYLTLCCIFLAVLTLVYWPGLYGPFLLDDLQSIEPARLTTFSWERLIEISLKNDTGPLGRPLSVASFALNHCFFGSTPFAFKLVNLVLHLIVGITLGYTTYLLMLFKPRIKSLASLIALLTALLWLAHPLHVSTVLYPVQRMTQLSALFMLISINAYLLGRLRMITCKSYAWPLISCSLFVFYPLAVLSKENAVIFPWILLAIEYFILRFQAPYKREMRTLKHIQAVLSLGVLFGGLLYYLYKLPVFLTMFAEKNITLFDRLLTQIKALTFYLQLIVFPQISNMGLYHDDFALATRIDLSVLLSGIVLLICAIVIYVCRKRAPVISFGLSWFFISHAIESSALPLEMIFEHRNYFASIGILMIPSYYFVVYTHSAKARIRYINEFCLAIIICLLLALTTMRTLTWKSAEKFLATISMFHPNSPRAHIETANWYLGKGNYKLAFSELTLAQQLQPNNAGISLHFILIHCHLQNTPQALYETAQQKLKQGAVTPYVIMVLDQLINNLFNQNCPSVDKKEIRKLLHTAQENPFLWYKPMYKAVLYHLEAGLALLNNKIDLSRQLLQKSFDTYPKRLEPLYQKAYIELRFGLYPQAEETIATIHTHSKSSSVSKSELLKLEQDWGLHQKKQKKD